MADNSRAINRVFTRSVIGDLLQSGHSDVFDYVVQRYIDDPESKTHGQLISEIYAHLEDQQRNEYYYLNTLLNKLLVGIHNVNSTTAFSQVHIGHSIADFFMINGEGRIYEIKSELDNFDRLSDQLRDYFRAVSKVSVLASEQNFDRVFKILSALGDFGNAVGIYVLSEQDTIRRKQHIKEPLQFDQYLEHSHIFKLLRKHEYEHIIEKYFGHLPGEPPVFYFKACLELFQKIPILEAQQLAFIQLKKRNKITKIVFERIQPELKSVVYFSELSKKIPEIEELLKANYRR